jgi:glycosyltransferase involved in cell wall biosynthesis
VTHLFLYTELAGYTLNCFKKHLSLNPGDTIHVIHHPINDEAPFVFEKIAGVIFYEKSSLGLEGIYDLYKKIKPDSVIISGWMDRDYLKVGRMIGKLCPVGLIIDNPWTGSIKQWLLLPMARILLHTFVSWCWVPGERQALFASKLGFTDIQIQLGFYATDIDPFLNMGLEKKEINGRKKRFICVARYIPEKAYPLLWSAFRNIYTQIGEEWELWCVGTGVDYEYRIEHPGIRHLGFVQPSEMEYIINQSDVFVLPSRYEPWGMVVQEFAAAGFPLLLSTAVGASEAFLKHEENGYFFQSESEEALTEVLLKAAKLSSEDRIKMGQKSRELAAFYSAETWSRALTHRSFIR